MLNIGDFARLGGVSVRMLRHYDDLGLLRPAEVDAWTGRRRYEVTQLGDLNRLVAFKDLGFTLKQVGDLLRDGVQAAEVRGMLRLHRAELAQQLQDTRHRFAQIDARLRLVESEHGMCEQEVVVKRVEPMLVAALSEVVVADATFAILVEELFVRAAKAMDATGLSRRTPVSWYLPEPSVAEDTLRVYAGYVVTGDASNLEIVEIPGCEVASVIHRGAMEGAGWAHQTLARWADTQGYEFSGPARRKRSIFLEANGEDQADWVVDVQLELIAVRGASATDPYPSSEDKRG